MQVRLFGELEAEHAGVPVPVRGAKQRALLALLALRPGQPVSADRLIDVLWGDGQAAHPANALQAQIGQLRRTFGPAAIITTEAGYALAAGPDEVDVIRFEHLVARGRLLAEAGQAADASAALGEALGLRRGEPLADFAYAGFFDAERARLDELVLVAIETRAGADLVLGRHAELAAGLEAWCRAHPLRERLWELRILALYRAGRQAEALQAYTEVRDRLVGELGIDPGPPCATLKPASWPSIPRSVPNPSRPNPSRPSPSRPNRSRPSPSRPNRSRPNRSPLRRPPCWRRSSMSRGRGGIWCHVRAWPSGSIAAQRRSSHWYPRPRASARRRCLPSGSRRDHPRRLTGGGWRGCRSTGATTISRPSGPT